MDSTVMERSWLLAALLPSLLLGMIGVGCLTLAWAAARRRGTPGAGALAALNAAIALWALAYAVQLQLPGLAPKLAATAVVYLGVVVTPVAWLLFAARYARRDGWLGPRTAPLLVAVPAITTLLVWTNGLHGLQWREIALVNGGGVATLAMRYGPWFTVHAAYSYALLAAGTVMLLRTLPQGGGLHRRQAVALIIAVAAPWAGNALHLLRLSPLFPLDITPFAFGLSAACFSWGLLRLRVLDVLPVAYGSVVAGMSDAVVVLDGAGRTVALNPAAQALLGLSAAWAVGRPAREALAALPAVAAAAEAAQRATLEVTHRAGGEARQLEAVLTPLAAARGRPAGLLVLLRDITPLRQAVERQRFLAEASALLASSLDYEVTLATITRLTVPTLADICSIHLVEPDGSLRRVALAVADPARHALVEELEQRYPTPPDADYGYPAAIRSGQPLLERDVAAADTAGLAVDERHRALLAAIGFRSLLAVPLIVHERTLGALTFASAESGRRYGPDDVALARELAHRAGLAVEHARLVAELRASEARARAANQAAEAATRAKSVFLAHASHEIRTPLTSLLGLGRLLLDTELDPWQRRVAAMLRSSGHSLLTVVNELLDLSRIESGRLTLDLAPVDLAACIEEALDLVAIQAEERRLDLCYAIEPGTPPVVLSNYVSLRQILVNLLGNAIKFTAAGSVSVTVAAEPLADPAAPDAPRRIGFAVHDTGVGIAPEDQPRLFRSFNQLGAPPGGRTVGSGLGLAISKQLCAKLGGTIGVTSAVGQGSTFQFSIAAAPVPEQPPAVPLTRQAALAGRRALLVAPERPSRAALAAQLRAWGMEPTVLTPEEAQARGCAAIEPHDLAIIGGAATDAELAAFVEALQAEQAEAPPRILLLPFKLGAAGVRLEDGRTHVLPLPLKYSQLFALLQPLVAPAPPAPAVAPEGEPLRILLAEDDDVNRLVLQHLLAQLGQAADVVADGAAALAALLARPYDVALLDVQMPAMTGPEVAAQITRERLPAERPYLVALTAYAEHDQRERRLGMDDYVGKPIVDDGLQAALARARAWLRAGHADWGDPPTDLPRLRATLRQGGEPVVAQLIGAYLSNGPALLAAVRAALERGDPAGMAAALHRLKSSSAIVTADRLAARCAALETLLDAGPAARWPAHVHGIEQEYARAARVLQAVALPEAEHAAGGGLG